MPRRRYQKYFKAGNPLSYRGMTFTWEQGQQLKKAVRNGKTIQYGYDPSGMRISKKAGSSAAWKYTYQGGKLVYETNRTQKLRYFYDENGEPFGVYLNSGRYLYEKNLQGDIIGIIDESGVRQVSYVYDAWGKVSETNVTGSSTVANLITYNHLLYWGYCYDRETGLYYLNSRYYDPETGRFINADDTELLGANGDVRLELFRSLFGGYNVAAQIHSHPNQSPYHNDFPSIGDGLRGGDGIAMKLFNYPEMYIVPYLPCDPSRLLIKFSDSATWCKE